MASRASKRPKRELPRYPLTAAERAQGERYYGSEAHSAILRALGPLKDEASGERFLINAVTEDYLAKMAAAERTVESEAAARNAAARVRPRLFWVAPIRTY